MKPPIHQLARQLLLDHVETTVVEPTSTSLSFAVDHDITMTPAKSCSPILRPILLLKPNADRRDASARPWAVVATRTAPFVRRSTTTSPALRLG